MNATRIAETRARHMKFLSDALVLQIEMKRAQLLSNGVDEDKLQDEISVLLMADLQEKQSTESNAVANVLSDKVSQVEIRPARKRQENSVHDSIFGNGLLGGFLFLQSCNFFYDGFKLTLIFATRILVAPL